MSGLLGRRTLDRPAPAAPGFVGISPDMQPLVEGELDYAWTIAVTTAAILRASACGADEG